MLGDLRQFERAGRIDDDPLGVVNFNAGQRRYRGASGDQDVGGRHVFARNGNSMGILERGRALQPIDLVLLEQELDPAGQILDRRGLLALHNAQIELNLAGLDPELGECAASGLLEQLRAMQQRLGRDAADIEACAAKRLARFGAGDFQVGLGSTDRGDIAAGACADDEHVVVVV